MRLGFVSISNYPCHCFVLLNLFVIADYLVAEKSMEGI